MRVVEKIGRACMSSGLFKVAGGVLVSFVPIATLPIALVNAGVDRVCADPTRFAFDVTTAEWLIKQFSSMKAMRHHP